MTIARGESTSLPTQTPTLVTFLVGGGDGLFIVAHTVRLALDRWKTAAMTCLVPLVIVALRAPSSYSGSSGPPAATPSGSIDT